MTDKTSKAYVEGYLEQAARSVAKRAKKEIGATGNAGMDFAEIAGKVAKQLSRDNTRKQRILAGSPHLAHALDAEELAEMSASELARAELKILGINYSSDSDPVEIRDAFHAGRMHERQGRGASSSMDSDAPSFLSNYLKE